MEDRGLTARDTRAKLRKKRAKTNESRKMPLTMSEWQTSVPRPLCCLPALPLPPSIYSPPLFTLPFCCCPCSLLTISLPAQVFYERRQYLLPFVVASVVPLLLPLCCCCCCPLLLHLSKTLLILPLLLALAFHRFACRNLLELSLFSAATENCFPLGWLHSLCLGLICSHANATRCYSLCTFNWDLLCNWKCLAKQALDRCCCCCCWQLLKVLLIVLLACFGFGEVSEVLFIQVELGEEARRKFL